MFFQAPKGGVEDFVEEDFTYAIMSEKEILDAFWKIVDSYDRIITFNGHVFDIPYVVLRSIFNGIRPSRNLLVSKYLHQQKGDISHVDLFDQFTLGGLVSRRGFSLDGLCSAFGIKSPKEEGVAGDQVGFLYNNNEYKKIAIYSGADAKATAELYKVWQNYLG